MMGLKFRSLLVEDAGWLSEAANDPDVAKYSLSVYPVTEHEIGDFLKKELEETESKHIVAELDGEPAGKVGIHPGTGRDRHVAWLGINVRRKHWGKGVGAGLMNEAIRLTKELGCRKLMLGTIEGNERAIRLYKKFGFENEAYEEDAVYIDGSWRKSYIMGLQLAPCEPKLEQSTLPKPLTSSAKFTENLSADIHVRQLMNKDLDEANRIQNCTESTKSCQRIPPTTKEETKRWYEKIKSTDGKYCIACFKGDKILGYLRFSADVLPWPRLRFEEVIVDVDQKPEETANALIAAIKEFKERYGYHRIFAYMPQTSSAIIGALKNHGFKNTGAGKCCFFVDGYYVDVALFGYP
jgi:putative acetyltransferase